MHPSTARVDKTSVNHVGQSGSPPVSSSITALPLALAARSAPRRTDAKNGFATFGTTSAIACVRPRRRLRAAGFGWYPSSRAIRRTRSRCSSEMRPFDLPLITSETVAWETPAARATSWPVTRRSAVFIAIGPQRRGGFDQAPSSSEAPVKPNGSHSAIAPHRTLSVVDDALTTSTSGPNSASS